MSRCSPYSFSEFKKQKEERIVSSIKLLKEKGSDNRNEAKEKRRKEKKGKNHEKKSKNLDKRSKNLDKIKDRREKKIKKDITKDDTLAKNEKKHSSRKRTLVERSDLDSKCDYHPKTTKEGEIEQLERSSLTEELCLPASQYVCDSPDSCQNSHKRTKLNAIDVPKNTFGNGLLIRLQLSKQGDNLPKQPSVALRQQREPVERPVLANPACLKLPIQTQSEQTSLMEQPCLPKIDQSEVKQVGSCLPMINQSEVKQVGPCFSMINQSEVKQVAPCLPFLKKDAALPSIKIEQPGFSGRSETTLSLCQEKSNTAIDDLNFFKGRQLSGKSRKKEAKFRDLIINWQSCPLQVGHSDEVDQNWLFGDSVQKKQQDVLLQGKEIAKADENIIVPSWPPQTHLLKPDLIVLPYILPF